MSCTTRCLVLFALVAACMPSHDPATLEQSQGACVGCHINDYVGTTDYSAMDPAVPDHYNHQDSLHPTSNGRFYPQTCADCHNTTTWFSHPEALFPRTTGPHTGIECTGCHTPNADDNTADALGANTNCVSCHPATESLAGGGTITTGHTDQDQTKLDYTKPNMCLSCHPTGLEKPHNQQAFPADHHGDNTCSRCHDRTKGSDAAGQNADCRRCHSVSQLRGVGDHDSFDPATIASPGNASTGCLRCHYGGSGGGDGG